MHPDELLEQLKKTANVRKQRNLDIIHDVCREQYERGSKDFSVATIARIAQKQGGPVKGSIHNKTGDDFKGLIKAWAEHTGGVTRKAREVSPTPYEALIERIENPGLRSLMLGILAENRQLRRKNTLLKSEAYRVLDMRPQVNNVPVTPIEILPASTGLLPSEIDALRKAVSAKFLADEGWSCDEEGRVHNDRGRTIFRAGFATAIRKIIGEDDAAKGKQAQSGRITKGVFGPLDDTD